MTCFGWSSVLVVACFACRADAAADPFGVLYDIITVRKLDDGRVITPAAATPLLWADSRYLVDNGAPAKLTEALNALNAIPEARFDAYPPVNRAILQHHVWTVFDWTTLLTHSSATKPPRIPGRELFKLQQALATTIRKLALSKAAILRLPSPLQATVASRVYRRTFDPENVTKPFLPEDIYDGKGPWVCLSKANHAVPAKIHTASVNARSAFMIFLRLPNGREQTLEYLNKLAAFRSPWLPGPQEASANIPEHAAMRDLDLHVNPKTPQFPVGTQVALVKQALLITDSGLLVLSPLIQDIQLRAYLNVYVDRARNNPGLPPSQALAEFYLQPRQLMLGRLPMRAVAADEVHHTTTLTSSDPIENPRSNAESQVPRLKSCMSCHPGAGIHSINSYGEFFQRRSVRPPRFVNSTAATIGAATARLKRKDYSWGLLQGLWRE